MLFTSEGKTISRYERKEVKVTDEHVKSVLSWLTDRDLEILRVLVKEPFLTTSQIEMMFFNDLKPSSWRTKANARLSRLYQTNCVDRFFPRVDLGSGSSESHYVLDYAGARALAMKLGYTNPKQFKFRKRNYIPAQYKHLIKITDFKSLLHVLNRQLGYTSEGTVGEIIKFDTQRMHKFHYSLNNKIHEAKIFPDAFCIYKYTARGDSKFFYLECDNATEPIETLQQKMLNYRRFHASGEWRQEKWARATNVFPSVLFVFHDQKSVDEMVSYSRRLNSSLRFLFTTYDKLYTDNVMAYPPNSHGKTRNVVQERNVRILDSIWSSKDGLVSL